MKPHLLHSLQKGKTYYAGHPDILDYRILEYVIDDAIDSATVIPSYDLATVYEVPRGETFRIGYPRAYATLVWLPDNLEASFLP